MTLFKNMDPDHILWEEHSKKFSKREITEMLRQEKIKSNLLREAIKSHKLLMKQAIQRLNLSEHLKE